MAREKHTRGISKSNNKRTVLAKDAAKAPDFGAQGPGFPLGPYIWLLFYVICTIAYPPPPSTRPFSPSSGLTGELKEEKQKTNEDRQLKESSLLAIEQIVVIQTHLFSSPPLTLLQERGHHGSKYVIFHCLDTAIPITYETAKGTGTNDELNRRFTRERRAKRVTIRLTKIIRNQPN
ncbi:hypothetical protein WN55_11434 [Dufourea novaeangliae]|uniref:Uncharacterized protein n=1 Tax=Dufourea novaeangliae TaxID=178035 RepID=A0A154PAV8_DUFNO|nr:hypothetical protein WN55_11434 [Dufourea novaeangliae]